MKYGIIDTHAHVACEDLIGRIDEIIENAKEQNIIKILIVCTSIAESKLAIQLAQDNDLFDCAVGFHPEDANTITDEDLLMLAEILKHPKVVALGEIGLDYYWVQDNKEKQQELFIKQIELAKSLNLPIIVHMRDATDDTTIILREHLTRGVLHCYSGSYETSKILLKLGYYLSFAGPLTYKNAKDAPHVCKEAPLDRLFVETDSPYLTPHPHRGKQNEPAYVHFTFEKLCEIKEIAQDEAMNVMIDNYRKLFTKTNL